MKNKTESCPPSAHRRSPAREALLRYAFIRSMILLQTTLNNTHFVDLSRITVLHMFIGSLLFFPDYNGGEIMHLPGLNIYDREIGKNPLIGHAHPFHQGCLVEKVQLK